ncbi:hypothetical protein F0562_027894 [Nyssa sinensis]|uniref:Uncharacterized protein n=1 Tax=Nyssa sinensis TaxID=561372 RepID=A0A5J5B505_9ASTE|nr:hypothetical protein F0562_027894 [Nyssa sinensis]
MEVGTSSNATLLDNLDSISAYASQPEFSTKIKDQQESPYTIQPINPMEIGTTSSDPLLDCPTILPRESYQHPSGHVTSMPSNQPPRHNAVAKVHGKDGAAMVAQGAAESFSSPIITNAKDSNVHFHHDLSELLLESSLDDIRAGDDDVAMDEASIHNTYSAHSWADRVEELPQATLDLEAEYWGFLEDLSFLMESLHGGLSTLNLRGRRSFNNGSHGGRGGRGRVSRVARGIQDQKLSFNSFYKAAFPKLRSAYVSNSHGFSAATKGDVQDYGRPNTQEALGCDKWSFQGRKKGESAVGVALFCPALCDNSGATQ